MESSDGVSSEDGWGYVDTPTWKEIAGKVAVREVRREADRGEGRRMMIVTVVREGNSLRIKTACAEAWAPEPKMRRLVGGRGGGRDRKDNADPALSQRGRGAETSGTHHRHFSAP